VYSGGQAGSEIHKEQIEIREIELVQMGKLLVMIVVLSNDRVLCYQQVGGNKTFRFKMVESQALRKKIGIPK
jgi:hypothetical protein